MSSGKTGDEANQLPRLIAAGLAPMPVPPERAHTVVPTAASSEWHLSPLGRRVGELKLWQSYSREEIPALFGFEFSTAIRNAGFVKRPSHMSLLVTLDKSGHAKGFQYHDRFTSRTVFSWQSQNRTTQDSADGQRHPATCST